MTVKRWTRLFSVAAVAIGVGLLVGALGVAHPSLAEFGRASSPQPGSILDEVPSEVRLVFSEESVGGGLVPDQSIFWVYREQGAEVVATGEVDLDVAARNVMVAELPDNLEPGIYVVKWVGISQGDAGFSEGRYNFAVTGAGDE